MSGFSTSRRALIQHLRDHALRTDGPFTLRSGAVTSWYLDARRTTFDGGGARLVAEAILEVLHPAVQAVGGMTIGADPMAVSSALVGTLRGRPLRAFSIRKAAKEHGTGGRLVGPVDAGDVVAVLEDTTTTGGALLEAIDVAVTSRLEVAQAVVLADRSGGVAAGRLAERNIGFVALVSPEDLGVEE